MARRGTSVTFVVPAPLINAKDVYLSMKNRKVKKRPILFWDVTEINGVKYKAGISQEQREKLDRWVYTYDEKAHKPVKDAAKFMVRAHLRIIESRQ